MLIKGYIGNYDLSRAQIEELKQEHLYEIIEINHKDSIDSIKEFRNKISVNGLKKKIGIINYLNCFTLEAQSMMLKIFEDLQSFDQNFAQIYFIATGFVNFSLQTRANVKFVNSFEKDLVSFMQKFKNIITQRKMNKKIKSIFDFYFKIYELNKNNYLTNSQAQQIYNKLGFCK